jgi:hypothetical protein
MGPRDSQAPDPRRVVLHHSPRPRVERPVAASPPIRATTLGLVLVLLGILVGLLLFSLK